MPAILNTGRDLIAQKQAAGQPLIINQFILADLDGLDPSQPVNPNEATPAASAIVWRGPVTKSGYVSPDQVVYSLLLGVNVGDFYYNWVGLQAEDGTLVAAAYTERQPKRKTQGVNLGNTITRNFMIAFTDAQAVTQITVNAQTWQIDFTARLDGIDERERLSNLDIYGAQAFLGDGFLLRKESGQYTLKAGQGYVGGVRVAQDTDQAINPGSLPKNVWLDVSLQGNATDVAPVIKVVCSNADQASFVDGANRLHHLVKVASIAGDGAVTDHRNRLGDPKPLYQLFLKVADVADNLTTSASDKPLSAAQGKALKQLADAKLGATQTAVNADKLGGLTPAHYSKVADIVNNLTTNLSNKPLSAAQGVALKQLADAKLGATQTAVNADKLGGLTPSHYQKTSDRIDAARLVNVPSQWTAQVGLSNSVSSTNQSVAASSYAVKIAYDLANAALPRNGKAADASKLDGLPSWTFIRHTDQTSHSANNGYVRTSTGIIIQWGTVGVVNDGSVPFSFPIAFPSICYVVVGNRMDAGSTKILPIHTWNHTAFYVDRSDSIENVTYLAYVAIGR
ncbi:conserved hypothetical protein [Hahella chejuensis KCTC 2396]|uniref:Tail fiber protein n=1 Tax=Hahella chejuensis (strain KCTC 2396) TaxID=349521 RepID=Q2S7G8_HAHCH|nr:phage tail protein [Hahella chejuensis]ABC33406.1 conserved hypothetical protein [Hahella chejuensis KCTC 2396]